MSSALPHTPSRTSALALGRCAATAGLVWALACGGADDPARQIERQRGHYSVKLTGWVVAQTPPAPDPAALAGASLAEPAPSAAAPPAADGDAERGASESEAGLVAAPPAVSDIDLAFEIRHDSAQKLNGLTVEVTQGDGMGKEKAHYRVWLDTADVEPAVTVKRTYTLKEVPHQAGDVFTAALRRRVPRAEWSLYKEFPTDR
jgi:hypothetical protein